MRIVGINRPETGGIEVAALSETGDSVTVIAPLRDFWTDPTGHLDRAPAGPTLPASDVEFVPPVLPEARVICIGLNYLKHVAEGSYRDQDLPEHPTLFARWTRSLTVDGAEVPVPSNEDGLDWEGEIVAWVGAPLVDADPDEALAAVVGYSTFNDLTSPTCAEAHLPMDPGQERRPVRAARPDGAGTPRSATCGTGCACRPGSTADRPGRHHRPDGLHRRRNARARSPAPSRCCPVTCSPPAPRPGSATPAPRRGCCSPATSSRSRSSGSACCATPSSATTPGIPPCRSPAPPPSDIPTHIERPSP